MEFKIFGKKFEINFKNSAMPQISNDSAWREYLAGSGHCVSHETALKVAVVLRCADVVAKTMASLGCHLYKNETDGKTRATSSQLYELLRILPNKETTAYEFWHMYIFNLMLTSGAYAKIVRDGSGAIRELWNIPTSRVQMCRNSNTNERYVNVFYLTGEVERIYESNFMYTPGLRFSDSECPEDFIKIASEVLGLTMDLNSYAKDYFENGSNPGGFLEYPTGVNAEAFTKFKEDWGKMYSGVMNQHKWVLLEGGFKATKMDSDPEKAQALESRKFQVIDVCRIMGVPPHKVFAMETTSYNSMEQANIEYVNETLGPMDERVCQTIYKDLLNPMEQKKHYARFNTNKLLKGDINARTAYYNTMRNNGVMSANHIRELEEMNRIPTEDGGDVLLVNGNFISLANAVNNLPKSMQNKEAQPNAKT